MKILSYEMRIMSLFYLSHLYHFLHTFKTIVKQENARKMTNVLIDGEKHKSMNIQFHEANKIV